MFRATFYPVLIAILSMLCTVVACKKNSPERLRIPSKSSFGQLLLPAAPTAPTRQDTDASGLAHYAAGTVYSAPYVHAHNEVVRQALHQVIRNPNPLHTQGESAPLDVHSQLAIGSAGLRLIFAQTNLKEPFVIDASPIQKGTPSTTQEKSGEPHADERTFPTP